jgi:hypothetical protein
MSSYTSGDRGLNFDAVIVLALVRARLDSPALAHAFERADARLDRDRGHPLRRFLEPDFRLPPAAVAWEPTAGAAGRVNPDRLLVEALHCRDHGWRPGSTAYACGPMRDGGGYHSAHGLWALLLARERGCLPASADVCIDALRHELDGAQPLLPAFWSTLDVDLYAERAVMLSLSGRAPQGVAPLLERQNGDGSWGVESPGEDPYFRFHATMMAAWALSLAVPQ